MGSGLDNLSKAFDEKKENDSPDETMPPAETDRGEMIKRSRAIVRVVERMKAQGIPVTKKAELDYLLAVRFLERADIEIPQPDFEEEDSPHEIKRNPKNNPEEFQVAMEFSKKTVADIEADIEQGKAVSNKQLEDYELCKRFLKKYS